jgi:hypothetical protein
MWNSNHFCSLTKEQSQKKCQNAVNGYGKFWIVIMKRDRQYSEDFANALSQLEMEIEDDERFNAIVVNVMDFPLLTRDQFDSAVVGLHAM